MLTYATAAICALIFARLFTYQRNGARFRRAVSLLAAGVMMCCGAAVIYIITGKLKVAPYAWPMVGMLAVFAAGVWRCRGNLAAVLDYPQAWDGRERRHVPK